ncbi:site-specific DNA-methyltransferase [Streptomyces sindenensis]|uniref:Site-specific DNA-methyltransferase n=1 Tax=Streptomyces sindenensis TaxID=67363 RepID=A0ABW6EPQ5_9ACTN
MHTVEPGDPETHSKDLVAENLEQLRKIFPSAFTEGKVDFDALRELLGDAIEDGDEKFGLSWFGKRNARRVALRPSTATLLPRPEESVDWDTTRNVMIEGDNLEVLKLLQKSYANKVKLIYIDPPYNTGKDFIYPDSFQDSIRNYLELTGQTGVDGGRLSSNSETSGRYHSAWLDMMYPRLTLARNLLKDDGVIFVSIDDHEVHNLRSVMDEIFGPENFVNAIIWQKVYSPKNSARHFSEDHDYLLVYARNADKWTPGLLPRTAEQDSAYKNPDNDPRGPWKAGDLSARNYYSKGTYSITTPSGRVITGPPPGTYWRYSEQTMREMDSDGRIWWGRDGSNSPAVKRFLSEVKQGRVPQTFWPYSEVGHNQDAKKELLQRVKFATSDSVFDTPKPVRLLRRVLTVATNPAESDIVLDFFAGSGTMGDAVMQANAEDGGNRRFVLVQIPELTGYQDFPSVAEITKARLRSASETVISAQGEAEVGFRSFSLGEGNIVRWDTTQQDFEQQAFEQIENVRQGRSDQDILFELMLSQGLDIASAVETRVFARIHVFATGGGLLFACLPPSDSINKGNVEEIAQGIIAWRDELEPETDVTVFLKDVAFADDVAKANLVAILEQHESPFVVKSV